MIIVTADQMQTLDRQTIDEFGIPGRVLMENAGRGATHTFLQRVYGKGPGKVGVLAGRGNNGGDGFVMARYLSHKGIDVTVYLLATADKVKGDAAQNLTLLRASRVPVIEIPDAEHFPLQQAGMRHIAFWIDALLGTGLNSEVKGFFRRIIEFINELKRPVFAVDIPSGLNADTGQPCGTCIQAAATATFAFAKIGHVVQPGIQLSGQVDVIDIGIPPAMAQNAGIQQQLMTGRQIQSLLVPRQPDTHKGHTGHALIVAGATGKTGAAAMAANAAMRAGAGLVSLGIPQTLNVILESQLPETMTIPLPDQGTGLLLEEAFDEIVEAAQSKQAMALGPGLGTASHTRNLVHRIIKEIELPLVIDADGLNNIIGHIKRLKARKVATILTPHPGEMARLTEMTTARIQRDRVTAARSLALQTKAYVVLKGARTLIASPDGRIFINPTGNPGMASGGMGDVLTGLITGMLTQGHLPLNACRIGVYLHGLAADMLYQKAPWGYLATEVINTIPLAINSILNDPQKDPMGRLLL
jgi:ADP-dependent NAD(P)H-hydrate dehydratase / NAD(P)H-hydrate epimerase